MIELPSDIDKQILELIAAMNRIPGIETGLSCCGHGEHPIRIWFLTDSLESLEDFRRSLDGFVREYGWEIIVDVGLGPVLFRLEGPVGAYHQAREIAAFLNSEVDEELSAGSSFRGWIHGLILRCRSPRRPQGSPADEIPF